MIKRNTWILLALFLALAGWTLYQTYRPESEKADPNATPTVTMQPVEFIFPSEAGTVTSIQIASREGETVRMVRAKNGWALVRPLEAAADAGSAQEAASQVTAITILNRLDLDPSVVGLTSPAYVITIGYENGVFLSVEIGDVTPTESGYYARKEGDSVVVLSKYSVDALLNLLTAPPYAQTPTPSPIPPTATLTPAVTAMPGVTNAP